MARKWRHVDNPSFGVVCRDIGGFFHFISKRPGLGANNEGAGDALVLMANCESRRSEELLDEPSMRGRENWRLEHQMGM